MIYVLQLVDADDLLLLCNDSTSPDLYYEHFTFISKQDIDEDSKINGVVTISQQNRTKSRIRFSTRMKVSI